MPAFNFSSHFDHLFEKFSEPRTMPGGWDLSCLPETKRSQLGNGKGRTETIPTERNLLDTGAFSQTRKTEERVNKEEFFELHTHPSGWDLSHLLNR